MTLPNRKTDKTENKVNKAQTRNGKLMLAATLALVAVVSLTGNADAQVWNPNPNYDADSSMWLPNVENGSTQPPYSAPPEGQAPPIGDGYAPMGINTGHAGYGVPTPASHVNMPLIPPGPDGKAAATAAAAGYLTPPTIYPTSDPGSIDSPPDFYQPPVTVTNINSGGGISGSAPIQRWGGQTSEDHGLRSFMRGTGGSQTTDFGERLSQKSNLQKAPQSSEDGPRNQQSPGQRGQANRSANLPGAQSTTDLNGNRTFFKGENLRARLTIAPY